MKVLSIMAYFTFVEYCPYLDKAMIESGSINIDINMSSILSAFRNTGLINENLIVYYVRYKNYIELRLFENGLPIGYVVLSYEFEYKQFSDYVNRLFTSELVDEITYPVLTPYVLNMESVCNCYNKGNLCGMIKNSDNFNMNLVKLKESLYLINNMLLNEADKFIFNNRQYNFNYDYIFNNFIRELDKVYTEQSVDYHRLHRLLKRSITLDSLKGDFIIINKQFKNLAQALLIK